jgi:hypothetical protein
MVVSALLFASLRVATCYPRNAAGAINGCPTLTLENVGSNRLVNRLLGCLNRVSVSLRPDAAGDDGTFPRQGFIRSSDRLDLSMLALANNGLDCTLAHHSFYGVPTATASEY